MAEIGYPYFETDGININSHTIRISSRCFPVGCDKYLCAISAAARALVSQSMPCSPRARHQIGGGGSTFVGPVLSLTVPVDERLELASDLR